MGLHQEAVLAAGGEVRDGVGGRCAGQGVGEVGAVAVLGDRVGVGAVDRVPGQRHLAVAGGLGLDVLGGRSLARISLGILQIARS